MTITFLVLLAALALLSLVTLARWVRRGGDGRPRPIDPTYVDFPELYGRSLMGLR